MNKKFNMKLFRKIIFAAAVTAWTAAVFSFSLQTAKESGGMSMRLTKQILAFFSPGYVSDPGLVGMWNLIFRKCAHFTEFLILGVLSFAFMSQTEFKYKKTAGILFCVAVASADETIQLFVNGRAGSVRDVCIDVSGAAVGVFALFMCMKIASGIRERRSKCEKTVKKR